MSVLLQAEGLRKSFGGVTAVDGVDLTVGPRDLLCIIGPNGAGKSTLFNMLCGTIRPSQGHIAFRGRDITRLPLHRFARIGIARKFQAPSVFESMTVADNLDVAILPERAASTHGMDVDAVLVLLNLEGQRHVLAGDLSHGQKQWLEIGMALMNRPALLLLDEPTAGMSREETQKTAQLLTGLDRDFAVVVIEHDMSFVRALACHTMVLHQGRVIREGPYAEIERDELVRDVYLGRR